MATVCFQLRHPPRTLTRVHSTKETCTVRVPCSLIARAEAAVPEEEVEGYIAEALRLGLGLLERGTSETSRMGVASEFEALSQRLEAWELTFRERLERVAAASESRQTAALDKYLGSSGALENQVASLRKELGDPALQTSIPAATATAVAASMGDAVAGMKQAIDASNDTSELGKFLRASRVESAQLRLDMEKDHQKFAADLKADLNKVLGVKEPEEANVKGRGYEIEVAEALVRLGATFGDAVTDTSLTRAQGSMAKVGDLLVDFGSARMAVEVKAGTFTVSGAKSIEKQLRDAVSTRGADVGLAVVKPDFLPKKYGWYTTIRDDLIIVAFDADLDYGDVALGVAYRALRAAALAAKAQAAASRAAQADEHRASARLAQARARAVAVNAKAADVLASLDKLRRMKKNTTDAINMLTTLRQDLDVLERDIKDAMREMDSDLQPLLAVTSGQDS